MTANVNSSGDAFSGEIRVAARVIDFLSSGLYQNAAACMKELVNNSYDADADVVQISVKPDADYIAVEDDGIGMTREQFQTHFERVAESHKRDASQVTAKGRMKIGKIGIGFIAANELCDEMEIYSTCEGSTDLLHVEIDFGSIRNRSISEKRDAATGTVVKADYTGEVLQVSATEHYTKIYLKRIRESARDEFLKPSNNAGDDSARSLYGLKPESVRDLLAGLSSWDELDLYSQTRLKIGLNVPVKYLPEWHPAEYGQELERFTNRAKGASFKVIYDGTELFKPTVLTEMRGKSKVKTVTFHGNHITVNGYLFARHGALKPSDSRGLLIRVREAAVSEYDGNFLGYPKQLSPLFQDWVSAEIYVDGELDDALNIDRRTLRDTHPAVVELRGWFIEEYGKFLREVKRDLYTEASKERKTERIREEVRRIDHVRAEVARDIGPEAAESMSEMFSGVNAGSAAADRRRTLQTFSVAELYELALDVAREVLPRDLASKFIEELSRRIS